MHVFFFHIDTHFSLQLLIGYESGQLVLWDLRNKIAEFRYQPSEPLKSLSWHHEGKQFMCSHSDGSLTTWSIRQGPKPVHSYHPHGKYTHIQDYLKQSFVELNSIIKQQNVIHILTFSYTEVESWFLLFVTMCEHRKRFVHHLGINKTSLLLIQYKRMLNSLGA